MNSHFEHTCRDIPRFESYYKYIVCQDMLLKNNYTSVMELPRWTSITVNTTSDGYMLDKKHLVAAHAALTLMTYQKTTSTAARKSIAGFKLRQGQLLGCCVTLHHHHMYSYLDTLFTVVLPRVREFGGVATPISESGRGLAYGIDTLSVFPQIERHHEIFQSVRGCTVECVAHITHPGDLRVLASCFAIPLS
jgi:large subunit ribosomal protein L5